jgi:hypothetical protein
MTAPQTKKRITSRFGDLSLLRSRRWLAALALILVAAAAGSYFAGRAMSQSRVRELPSPVVMKTPSVPAIVLPAIPVSVAPLRLPVVHVSPTPTTPTYHYSTPTPTPKPTPKPSPTPSCNPC